MGFWLGVLMCGIIVLSSIVIVVIKFIEWFAMSSLDKFKTPEKRRDWLQPKE
jgi:hypothetical protein